MAKKKKRKKNYKLEPLTIKIKLDKGLASWLRALIASPANIYGTPQQACIFFIRNQICDYAKRNDAVRCLYPYLPPSIQKACAHHLEKKHG